MKAYKTVKVPIYTGLKMTMVADLKELDRWGIEIDDSWGGMAAMQGSRLFLVIRDEREFTPGTLAHEALHLSWYITDTVGIQLSVGNHEAQAYLVGWLFDTAYKFFSAYYSSERASENEIISEEEAQ